MTGHDFLRVVVGGSVAFLVTLAFISSLMARGSMAAHPSSSSSLQCLGPSSSSSFWLRNSCYGGYVTITKDRKVIAQHQGLDPHSTRVELVKESCRDSLRSRKTPRRKEGTSSTFGFNGSIKTRLYSPQSHRYICFNRRGKVVTKSRKSAKRMGRLCAFIERTVVSSSSKMGGATRTFVSFQSASNPRWYLGFNGKRRKQNRTGGKQLTLPRKMGRKRGKRRRRINLNKCDFSFSTGEWSLTDIREEYSGLIKHIRRQNTRNDEAAKSLASSSSSSVVDIGAKKGLYYYIESNDERYTEPLEKRQEGDDQEEDEEEIIEKRLEFVNFMKKMRLYKSPQVTSRFRKPKWRSSSFSSNSNSSYSSLSPL